MTSMIGKLFLSAAFVTALAAGALAQGAPVQLQPAKPAAAKPAPKPAAAVDDKEAVQRANAHLNSVQTMIADFVQIAGDGRRSEGKLYVQKPGRMRFEYSRPATLEIVSDGTSVAVRDRKLATQDVYLIGQTPLKFLLRDRIDISRDTKVLDVQTTPNAVFVMIEDKATLGGTSRIKLVFDPASFTLKQWTVNDPQGSDTVVSLFNVDTGRKPDPAVFKINTERMLNTNR
ncbi:MAG: outer-membrane lipoprotein carrier protein LolA [Methylobacteriaceae bacterium]|nr:outer-membrane lipoprotein carrier protein LolA [Methylobacteriaceae bacterium]